MRGASGVRQIDAKCLARFLARPRPVFHLSHYDPRAEHIELLALFEKGSPFDGPDNITAGPHGFALACTDGDEDQWLVGINDEGGTFPFAFNALNDQEFAGATFSPDGRILYVNLQGPPGLTLAIWGRWR